MMFLLVHNALLARLSGLFPVPELRRLVTVACVSASLIMAPAKAASLSASLSAEEQQFAKTVAGNRAWLQNRSVSSQTNHLLNVQTLSIEIDERKKNNQQRRARVYQFNYNTQQSRLILIDLDTRTIANVKPIRSVHLPLNEQEIAKARALVEQDQAIMNILNDEQQSRHLPPLTDLASIDVKASIFEPTDKAHPCAEQRCALISLFDHTRTVFSVEPLVNLQLLTVTKLQQSL